MRTYQDFAHTKLLNTDFTPPKHLGLPYENRKVISRIRCSNHPLAIEKGRQKKPQTPREERICILCDEEFVEDEDHFLLKCRTYSILREEYQMNFENIPNSSTRTTNTNFLDTSYQFKLRLIQGRQRD